MSGSLDRTLEHSPDLEPAWDVALLFPPQGMWSDQDYLALSTNRLVELSDGCVEVLPMPTMTHQLIVLFLSGVLKAFADQREPGTVLVAPFRVRLGIGKYREPDVAFMRATNATRMSENFWEAADLVMEVVSDDIRPHDLSTKRLEYAEAGIPEYWIVDPREVRITVLTLNAEARSYAVHGEFARGAVATSRLLPGFSVDVTAAFSQKP